ncbi:MAG: histidinol-phosphatase [Erysipelotrichaceae bacterium]|nr:histidinol-phosphatase [Erysipelotrichaceae bacterium]
MMITNFHTHTSRCRHAWGSDEDYVKAAIRNGYKILGFADHACWPYVGKTEHENNYPKEMKTGEDRRKFVNWVYQKRESKMRMSPSDFPDYVRSIKFLRCKYKHWIDIRLGLEAEYDPQYMDWMLNLCAEYDLDYLILGHHYVMGEEAGTYTGLLDKEGLKLYVQTAIEALETGMYAYMAHPEFFMRSRQLSYDEDVEAAFRQIAQAAARLDIPVEYNCSGMMANKSSRTERYPHHRFWEIAAEEGCRAVIGMDCHLPDYLDVSYYNQAREYLETLDIEIVEDIGRIDYKALLAKRKAEQNARQQELPKRRSISEILRMRAEAKKNRERSL